MNHARPTEAGEAVRRYVRRLRRAFVNLMPLLTLLVVVVEWNGIPGQRRDTVAYFDAAVAARSESQGIYEPLPQIGPHEFLGDFPYIYPPVLAAALALLPDTSYRTFDRGWLLANVVAFWFLAAALARISSGTWKGRELLSWSAVLFLFPGTWFSIHFGNMDLVVLSLIAWSVAVPARAGALLPVGIVLKVTPVLPWLVFLIHRPRAAVVGAASVLALSAAVCLHTFGYSHSLLLFRQWFMMVLPSLSQGQFWGGSLAALKGGALTPYDYFANMSPSFLPVQLAILCGWDFEGGSWPVGIRLYLAGFGVLVPLLTGWLTRRCSLSVQIAAVATAALWSAPIVRPYVLPAALILVAAFRPARRRDLDPAKQVSRSHA